MVTTWGLLVKSLTDAETIEEMVDRKITEHEENPESHMGVGESIDVHRKTEIVDHLAGSVLADKNTMTEIYVTDQFLRIDSLTKQGEVIEDNYPQIRFYTESGGYELARLEGQTDILQKLNTLEKDMMFQIGTKFDISSKPDQAFFGFGNYSGSLEYGIGFYWNGTTLKPKVKTYANNWEGSAISFTPHELNIFRFQYIVGENKLYFYKNGQKVQEWTPTFEYEGADTSILIYTKLITSSDAYVDFIDLQYALSI